MCGQKEMNHYFIDVEDSEVIIYHNGRYSGLVVCQSKELAEKVAKHLKEVAIHEPLLKPGKSQIMKMIKDFFVSDPPHPSCGFCNLQECKKCETRDFL